MSIAVLAEKPSVARDIARVLGCEKRGDGYLHGNGYVVTWAIGHLVALAQPHEIDPAWKRWRFDHLPILPDRWPLVEVAQTKDQMDVVRRILSSPKVERVVCATDAGREGELIFRYVYEAVDCKKPFDRLWISSLTPQAITAGFSALRDGHAYDPLADAARGRSRADWLVGMNLSRAYSLAFDDDLSVGRVQTPTLAMVVERELAIRAFVPETYLEVVATFTPVDLPKIDGKHVTYTGTWFSPDAPKDAQPGSASEKPSAAKDARTTVDPLRKRLPADGALADAIVARARRGDARVETVTREDKRLPPPLLYDLTELQRHANRLFGMSAKRTLDVAQELYETHKLLSYPRTDSRHLSQSVAATLGDVVAAVAPRYSGLVAEGSGEKPLSRRYVDDAKVTDHHAIIPTPVSASGKSLSEDARRIYDLVCRRLLSAWHGDYVWSSTIAITAVTADGVTDRYQSVGTSLVDRGWKVLDLGKADGDLTLPPLTDGALCAVVDTKKLTKQTEPPRRFTEATLLTAMETAGRTLDEKELSDAMRDSGLGTPATRASILETLLSREYLVRDGKSLVPTDKGIRLVSVVHPHVKSAAMTGTWEQKLRKMQRGELSLDGFMREIEAYVREVVAGVRSDRPPSPANGNARRPPSAPPPPAAATARRPPSVPPPSGGGAAPRSAGAPPAHWDVPPAAYDEPPPAAFDDDDDRWRDEVAGAPSSPRAAPSTSPPRRAPDREAPARAVAAPVAPRPPVRPRATTDAPVTSADLRQILKDRFGFDRFRPYQEEVCLAAAQGKDALLVMPTGAGKSLCYQLPGVARGGTTLVVSPLIALMEDQVAKLQSQGFAAERIHAGRDRESSRQVAADYLAGRLDFLFVAPERLAVRGFTDLVAKRLPTLVAIDEAHCISHWGHDFRPEYRMLGQRLPALRPAPIVALTATATPTVQDDIVTQLGLESATRFIHGFRRTNIAIEAAEVPVKDRPAAVRDLLADKGRRPAIVYAPTRKEAESLASALSKRYAVAAYHAGLPASERDTVQSRFVSGKLDVVVATIAFGMGIDKADVRTVVHVALPASIEGYYQEIGRAGRDGLPSRAVLLHSYADRRTHEFFLGRDFPEVAVIERLYAALSTRPQAKSDLHDEVASKKELRDEEDFDRALGKLWLHGGAIIDDDDRVTRGDASWKAAYTEIRNHRLAQLAAVARFAEGHGCRMVRLLHHFGDRDDDTPCGTCDGCQPSQSLSHRFAAPSANESASLSLILAALAGQDGMATGKLHKEAFPDESVDRRTFEHLLSGLARAGMVELSDEAFERDGERIHFRRAWLTQSGRDVDASALSAVPMSKLPSAAASRSRKPHVRPKKGGKRGGPSPMTKHVVSGHTPESSRARRTELDEGDPVTRALRDFRKAEAKKKGVPAFRVMTDRTLSAIAEARPNSVTALLAVPGMGPGLTAKYGDVILRLVKESR